MSSKNVPFMEFLKELQQQDSDVDLCVKCHEIELRLEHEIKQRREQLGLTQRELALRLGVTQPVVARLESNMSNPQIETLVRIARALECDVQVSLVKED